MKKQLVKVKLSDGQINMIKPLVKECLEMFKNVESISRHFVEDVKNNYIDLLFAKELEGYTRRIKRAEYNNTAKGLEPQSVSRTYRGVQIEADIESSENGDESVIRKYCLENIPSTIEGIEKLVMLGNQPIPRIDSLREVNRNKINIYDASAYFDIYLIGNIENIGKKQANDYTTINSISYRKGEKGASYSLPDDLVRNGEGVIRYHLEQNSDFIINSGNHTYCEIHYDGIDDKITECYFNTADEPDRFINYFKPPREIDKDMPRYFEAITMFFKKALTYHNKKKFYRQKLTRSRESSY